MPTIQGIEPFKETFCRDKPYRKNSWCCDGQARSLAITVVLAGARNAEQVIVKGRVMEVHLSGEEINFITT